MEAVKLLARLEGICLIRSIPVKRWPGLLMALHRNALRMKGRILFVHTGGAPALFAYHPRVKNQVEK
jgi:D-cysteine desulfhydrase